MASFSTPTISTSSISAAFTELLQILHRLRSPEGCPWDRAQTLESLRSNLLEETWEVIDTIERSDMPHLQEEMGDLLLNVLALSSIAAEAGHFSLEHVLTELCDKLVRRHPHVFGDLSATSVEEALDHWQASKEQERQAPIAGRLERILENQPALLFALELQKKAAKYGFDWPENTAEEDIIRKIHEEITEFSQAEAHTDREEEIGDILFSVVNLARHKGINPELAMGRSCRKFRQRFAHVETQLGDKLTNQSASLEEMDAAWQWAKAQK